MSTQVVWPLNENGEIVFSAGSGTTDVVGYLNQDVLPSTDGTIPVAMKGGNVVRYSSFAPITITGSAATTETVMAQVSLPSKLIGPNTVIRVEPAWSWTNSANTKTFNVKIGTSVSSSQTIYTRSRTTNVAEIPLIMLCNRGTKQQQIAPYAQSGNYQTNAGAPALTYNVDFTVDNTLYLTGVLANSADSLTLQGVLITILNSGV